MKTEKHHKDKHITLRISSKDYQTVINAFQERDESMKEKCRYLSEFIRYIILNFIVITAVKTKTKRINYYNTNIKIPGISTNK